MHMALPLRRSSNILPYSNRPSRLLVLRRSKLKTIALLFCVIGSFIFALSQIFGSSDPILDGNPPVVIVTVLDPSKYNDEYLDNIKENRMRYAKKHGYATFFPNINDYELDGAPGSWARVPAARHAISKFSQSTFIWYLNHNALIMNPAFSVTRDIMDPGKLDETMIKGQPILSPDGVIKTSTLLEGKGVDLVLSQDKNGLAPSSFILRTGDWGRFFLEIWFDPLYRSYNFQKAHSHALEHIVQWHPTILSRIALVPQRIINSYEKSDQSSTSGIYKQGDFIIEFAGCEQAGRSCAKEAQPYTSIWKTAFKTL
ncbi:hypothetical protein K3495_g5424 [Podosphaera aphanis]|nr:hypothetical protein K3495_g5424 [Podosphaera aphanis]